MQKILTISEAIQILLDGGVGVWPTDTLYGVVARAHDVDAVARLYDLKRREGKPGTLIAASPEQVAGLGIPQEAVASVADLWPASLSIVLPAGPQLRHLHQGKDSLAVRVPADAALRAVLERTGMWLTSSANQPGEPSANTITEAWSYFGDSVDFYVDGGDLSGRAASTLVRLEGDDLILLRPGAAPVPTRRVTGRS
jgi:L-threonylcarbamoyladenylate synthase